VGPRDHLDTVAKRKNIPSLYLLATELGHSRHSLVPILTELPWLINTGKLEEITN